MLHIMDVKWVVIKFHVDLKINSTVPISVPIIYFESFVIEYLLHKHHKEEFDEIIVWGNLYRSLSLSPYAFIQYVCGNRV